MTPQNYYARRTARRRQAVDLELVLALVRAERAQQSRLGVRKLYYLIGPELKAAGVKLGRDRLFAELGKVGLLVEPKPSEWPKTTHGNANLPVFKNRMRRCQQWSHTSVGFQFGKTLESADTSKALSMALRSLKRAERAIHH